MKTFVGLDVSQNKTGGCMIDHNGNKIRMAIDSSRILHWSAMRLIYCTQT